MVVVDKYSHLGPDDLYIDGAYLMHGELPYETFSYVWVNKTIKKKDAFKFAKEMKQRYNADRCNFRSTEKDYGR
jgi:predicted CoA-binding protein